MGNIRKSYTASDKLKIITYAEADGNRAAGREYDVGESNIRLWRYQKERLQKLPRSKMAERGKTAQFPDLEIELVKWITDRRMQGYAMSTAELKLKATHLARQSYTTANFRGSISWRYAFLKRHDLSIRRGTNIAQKLPSDYQEQLKSATLIKHQLHSTCHLLLLLQQKEQSPSACQLLEMKKTDLQ